MSFGPFRNVVGIAPIRATNTLEADLMEKFQRPLQFDYRVSHFLPARYFQLVVKEFGFYLTRADKQSNDPNDSRLPDVNLTEAAGMDQAMAPYLPTTVDPIMTQADYEEHRKRNYLHCWTEGWDESKRLWREFGGNGTGVMLRSTTGMLRAHFQHHDFLNINLVGCSYWPKHVAVPVRLGNLVAQCRKDERFMWQNETRLVAQLRDAAFAAKMGIHAEPPDGWWLGIRLQQVLSSIVIGPCMSSADRDEVLRSLGKADLSSRISPTILAAEDFIV